MKILPSLNQLTSKEDYALFSDMYFKNSALPIPETYMTHKDNRVFGIYKNKQLVGGFILGRDTDFRTVQFFAKEEYQKQVYTQLEDKKQYTEICCFWIDRKQRVNHLINFFTWLAMTYALRFYGSKYLLFGTCSRSLARLYGQTTKSNLIHQDNVNNKSTFIFYAKRSECVTGMFEIIRYKLKRVFKIRKRIRSIITV